MKTKSFNHFRNLFAFVGFFIIACSAAVELDSLDETPDDIDDTTPIVQNNIGKYQLSTSSEGTVTHMVVLNTETGVSKTYYRNSTIQSSSSYYNIAWTEFTNAAITFTH